MVVHHTLILLESSSGIPSYCTSHSSSRTFFLLSNQTNYLAVLCLLPYYFCCINSPLSFFSAASQLGFIVILNPCLPIAVTPAMTSCVCFFHFFLCFPLSSCPDLCFGYSYISIFPVHQHHNLPCFCLWSWNSLTTHLVVIAALSRKYISQYWAIAWDIHWSNSPKHQLCI